MPDNKYKQIVILSGKGGTGKTTIATAFAEIISEKIIIDADVDAANMHLVLNHKINLESDYFGGKKAEIILHKCSQCRLCESVCRFGAIKDFIVDKISCEGCGFCYNVCPDNAISFEETNAGKYFQCKLEDESNFYYAKLLAGEGNSGKLVSQLKKQADKKIDENIKWIIVDGPPGIGCPVNASLAGVNLVVIVTEPTQSGLHDLKRLIDLLKIFKIPSGVIINKYDINMEMSRTIEEFIQLEGIPLLAKINFEKNFVKAIQNSKSIIKYDSNFESMFRNIWMKIETIIKN
jgi:MinD superfamily P-loop ATPase